MGLPKCDQCRTMFSWGQVSKSLSLFYRPIICPVCKTENRITFRSRLVGSVIIMPIILIGSISTIISLSLPVTITLIIVTGLIAMLIQPYFMKYSSDENKTKIAI